MIRPLITALRTLTILPIPGKDTVRMAWSLPFFPLAGLLVGAVVFGLLKSMQMIGLHHYPVIAIIGLIAATVLSGALHIDGLGDVFDGFCGGKSRDHVFTIMKDSRLGTFGVCAIVFDLLLKTTCWSELIQSDALIPIVVSIVLSRWMQAIGIIMLPKAGKESVLNRFTDGGAIVRIWVFIVFGIVCTACWYFTGLRTTALLIAPALAISAIFGLWCVRRIGGINGDCIGAINEFTEISVVFVAVMIL